MRRLTTRPLVGAAVVLLATAVATRSAAPHSHYLFVWAMEARHPKSQMTMPPEMGRDFLAVFDVGPDASPFGKLIAMLPVGDGAQMAHHTNYVLPPNNVLFANDWMADRSYIFDLHDPLNPRLVSHFADAGPYMYPHSFVYLSNGNTLTTFQYTGGFNHAPGGIVELDSQGHTVKMSSAADPKLDPNIRPYSMAVVEKLNRVVTSSADMMGAQTSHVVQVWRLSDLKLLKTITLPEPEGDGESVATNSSEPRVLRDGETVLVPTFTCALYRVRDLAGSDPTLEFVYDAGYRTCEVPVVVGDYLVEAMQSGHAIVSLDMQDPSHPHEVSRILLKPDELPHWLAIEPGGDRLVIAGYGALKTCVLFATIDRQTGQLKLDPKSINFIRKWPDGWDGSAVPHGAVFSNK